MYGFIMTVGIIVCSVIMFSVVGTIFFRDIREQFKDKKRNE